VRRLRPGTATDPAKPLSFRWNGTAFDALAGDTLASGLLANGVRVVGSSVSFGRPRGVMSAGLEEAHAFAQIGEGGASEPLMRATTVDLHHGLVARGLSTKGTLVQGDDPARFEKRHGHCDVLVVGGGPAGLAAAWAASAGGARVILVETTARWGGALGRDLELIDGAPALAWVDRITRDLAARPEVTALRRTTAAVSLDQNGVVLVERLPETTPPDRIRPIRRLWQVRARAVVVATGALERGVVFQDNDRPGVMLASAVRSYWHLHGIAPATVVLFTTNDDGYRTAFDLVEAGVLVRVLDARESIGPVGEQARARGIEVLSNAVVAGTRADQAGLLAAARFQAGRRQGEWPCEVLAVAGGYQPLLDLPAQRPDQSHRIVGAAAGQWSLAECLLDGLDAGVAAAEAVGFGSPGPTRPVVGPDWDRSPGTTLWQVPAPDGDETRSFVDLHRDVTVAGLDRALGAGVRSVEHLKRYTLAGTGIEQGKSAKAAAGAIASDRLGSEKPLGVSTGRPPTEPIAFALLAGRARGDLFEPVRTTPAHPAHVAAGAVFENVGQWKRPRYFPRPGETMAEAVAREARAVRTGVAIMDASTLGKIEVQGADAAEFLDRLYLNRLSSLKVGRARYAAMCRLDGTVFDDGVVMRLAPDRFFVTTSTGHAASVFEWMEEWRQTEWPDLEVWTTSTTEQWATYAVAGPQARTVVQSVAPTCDLSREGFPFLGVRPATIAGIAGLLARVSFSGELAFEVMVQSRHGLAVWNALLEAGTPLGMARYGLEALSLLRAEKGYLIVGQDTDADTSPIDAGLGWMISDKDFLGRRSLEMATHRRSDRKQLVGFLPSDPAIVLPEGAQFVADPTQPKPMTMIGHVTTSHPSPTLGRSFGLALVRGGRDRIGHIVHAPLEDRTVAVEIVDPVFYDKAGARRDG